MFIISLHRTATKCTNVYSCCKHGDSDVYKLTKEPRWSIILCKRAVQFVNVPKSAFKCYDLHTMISTIRAIQCSVFMVHGP